MSRRFPIAGVLLAIVLLGACSRAEPRAVPVATFAPASPSVAPEALAEPVVQAAERRPSGELTARSIQQHIEVWRRYAPEERPTWTFDTMNPVGQSLAMLVTGERTDDAGIDWVRVLLPIRPNGSDGWVHAADVEVRTV